LPWRWCALSRPRLLRPEALTRAAEEAAQLGIGRRLRVGGAHGAVRCSRIEDADGDEESQNELDHP
jgi:hypothetical protein